MIKLTPLFIFFLFISLTSCIPTEQNENGQIGDEQEQVVTLYFSGTTMNSTMWRSDSSPFDRPETVAILHHFQKAGFDYPGHHKGIVDGFQGVEAALPNWQTNFHKAIDVLTPVTAFCEEKCIRLNLVGFSRGAVSTMHMVNQIFTNSDYESIKNKIKKTNILVFDPVPGDAGMSAANFNLPDNVEYIGFYSEDERSALFSPVFPRRASGNTLSNPPIRFFKVPGSHETMVGSTKINGHLHDLLGINLGFDDIENLNHVSSTLKIIVTEILSSSEWGHVRFTTDYDPELNLEWYAGETDIVLLQKKLSDKIVDMYSSPIPADYYRGMRDDSFDVFTEAWGMGLLGEGCWTGSLIYSPVSNLRCVYFGPYTGRLFGTLGLSDGSINDVTNAQALNHKTGENYTIWNLIREHGSLDVDADFVDYNEDNCPVIANRDQSDVDADGQGDACEVDADNDGIPGDTDECPYTATGQQVHPDNGCSLYQLVPCNGPHNMDQPWRNHGQYLSTLIEFAKDFVDLRLLTNNEKRHIVSSAARSNCGK